METTTKNSCEPLVHHHCGGIANNKKRTIQGHPVGVKVGRVCTHNRNYEQHNQRVDGLCSERAQPGRR